MKTSKLLSLNLFKKSDTFQLDWLRQSVCWRTDRLLRNNWLNRIVVPPAIVGWRTGHLWLWLLHIISCFFTQCHCQTASRSLPAGCRALRSSIPRPAALNSSIMNHASLIASLSPVFAFKRQWARLRFFLVGRNWAKRGKLTRNLLISSRTK